jgi:short subunit dehydrogenase-like uncharacterized protein
VVLCPGVGFDVTPTDCIALMLRKALPEAHELPLGFEAEQRMSPGTAKTAIEALGKSGKIRRGSSIFSSGVDVGRLISVGGQSWRCLFLGVTSPQPFPFRLAMRISLLLPQGSFASPHSHVGLAGYSLTVFSYLAIVERLIANGFAPGCWTPATIMGEDFIFSLPGTTTLELPR